jgi:hypothetical protein
MVSRFRWPSYDKIFVDKGRKDGDHVVMLQSLLEDV